MALPPSTPRTPQSQQSRSPTDLLIRFFFGDRHLPDADADASASTPADGSLVLSEGVVYRASRRRDGYALGEPYSDKPANDLFYIRARVVLRASPETLNRLVSGDGLLVPGEFGTCPLRSVKNPIRSSLNT